MAIVKRVMLIVACRWGAIELEIFINIIIIVIIITSHIRLRVESHLTYGYIYNNINNNKFMYLKYYDTKAHNSDTITDSYT